MERAASDLSQSLSRNERISLKLIFWAAKSRQNRENTPVYPTILERTILPKRITAPFGLVFRKVH
jgi:hypothetical protein